MFIKYKLREFSFPSGFRRRRAAGRVDEKGFICYILVTAL